MGVLVVGFFVDRLSIELQKLKYIFLHLIRCSTALLENFPNGPSCKYRSGFCSFLLTYLSGCS